MLADSRIRPAEIVRVCQLKLQSRSLQQAPVPAAAAGTLCWAGGWDGAAWRV